MFGVKAKVQKLRDALIRAMQQKWVTIHEAEKTSPSVVGAARLAMLADLIDVITNLVVDVKEDDE